MKPSAIHRCLILTSSPKKSLNSEAIAKLSDYVASGAILLSPNILSSASADIKKLFGVSDVSVTSKKSKRVLNWTSESHPELVYIDEPEELTTAIGSINVSSFIPSTGTKLAWFDDESERAAVVKNNIGKGATYLFGLLWRDVIQRPQLDKDMETGRGRSNTFEPSADIYPLFLRAAYVAANPVTAWKYTVPDGYSSVLIPTHDCDSRTAYDAMHYMADYERSLGLNGHYFLTVHYFKQPNYLSAFYCDETMPAARKLLADGHTVGSHSICHFPDFGSYKNNELEERFPMKVYTKEEYALYASHDPATKTSYGSTWAELVLSKQIIENDLGNKVRSFRSGHLCINSHMPEAHKIAGYNFSSCYTATSVQSQFPFMQRMKNDWTGDFSGTLQIPLHFSDVFQVEAMSEDNYKEKAKVWIELFNKLKGNYASSVILIHPNREWKMIAQKILIDNMDLTDCGLYNFEAYGDFWLGRTSFDFESFWLPSERKFIIRADADAIAANPSLSLMVELPAGVDAAEAGIANITLIDENSKVHPVRIRHISDSRYLVML